MVKSELNVVATAELIKAVKEELETEDPEGNKEEIIESLVKNENTQRIQ